MSVLLPDAWIAPPSLLAELLMKMLVPLKLSAALSNAMIAPPTESATELLTKLMVSLKLSTALPDQIALP